MAHRDLKPENLLLDETKRNLKLIDFGLSNQMRDGHHLKTACGSPNYAPPEIVTARLYSGQECDVWSMGVILYSMVCGKLPFDEMKLTRLFYVIKEGQYSLPPHLSDDVKDLLCRMLQPNPVKRITMRGIRNHPWFNKSNPASYLGICDPLIHSIAEDIIR